MASTPKVSQRAGHTEYANMGRRFLSIFYEKLQTVCYNTTIVPGRGTALMSTWSSDWVDYQGHRRAGGRRAGIPFAQFSTKNPKNLCTIELCRWFILRTADDQWPRIDEARIEKAMSEEVVNALKRGQTPVDSIVQTYGSSLLHEVHLPSPLAANVLTVIISLTSYTE